jgi:hypothetical protein
MVDLVSNRDHMRSASESTFALPQNSVSAVVEVRSAPAQQIDSRQLSLLPLLVEVENSVFQLQLSP